MSGAAILLAAGKGARMRGSVPDKALAIIAGKPLIYYSVKAFIESGCIDDFLITYHSEPQKEQLIQAIEEFLIDPIWVQGGIERQDSVYNALQKAPAAAELVYIHDCARPLIQPKTICALAQAASDDGAAVLATKVIDTIKQVGSDGRMTDIPRDGLWAMQTPQVFKRDLIQQGYAKVISEGWRITDDTAAAGTPVTIVENQHPNPKLTQPADLALLEYLLARG